MAYRSQRRAPDYPYQTPTSSTSWLSLLLCPVRACFDSRSHPTSHTRRDSALVSRRGRRHPSKSSDNRYRHVSQVMLPVTRDSLSEIDEFANAPRFSYPSSVWSEGNDPPMDPHGLQVYELLQRTAATTVYDNDPYDTYDFLLRQSRLDQYTPHALEPIHEVGHGTHILRRQQVSISPSIISPFFSHHFNLLIDNIDAIQGSRTLRQDVKNTRTRPDVRSVIQPDIIKSPRQGGSSSSRPESRTPSSRPDARSSARSDTRSSTRSPHQKPSSRSNTRSSPYSDGLSSRRSETRSSTRVESNFKPSPHSTRPHTVRRRERQATRAKVMPLRSCFLSPPG